MSKDYRYTRWIELTLRWSGISCIKLDTSEFYEWSALTAELRKDCNACEKFNGLDYDEMSEELREEYEELFTYRHAIDAKFASCSKCRGYGIEFTEEEKKLFQLEEWTK